MRKLIFSLLLSTATFTVNPLFAMEAETNEGEKKSITYIEPAKLELPEIILEATPHTCASCNPKLRFEITEKNEENGSLSIFPNDLMVAVLAQLPIEDILISSRTSKMIYNLCQHPDLWRAIAIREIPWQPQESIDAPLWWVNERTPDELKNYMTKRALAKQKPIKGTSWQINKSIYLNSNDENPIKRVPSPEYCTKDQVISDRIYYLHLFDAWDEDRSKRDNLRYWVKASQLKSFLQHPCKPTSCPDLDPRKFNRKNYTTYHFSIGKNQFEAYLHSSSALYDNNGRLNLENDACFYCGMPEIFSEYVFGMGPVKNRLDIKKLDPQEKSNWEKAKDFGKSIFKIGKSDKDKKK